MLIFDPMKITCRHRKWTKRRTNSLLWSVGKRKWIRFRTLLAARHHTIQKLKKQNPNKDDGLLLSKLIAYCSKESHSSLEKGAMIGFVKLRILEPDENFSLRGSTLKRVWLQILWRIGTWIWILWNIGVSNENVDFRQWTRTEKMDSFLSSSRLQLPQLLVALVTILRNLDPFVKIMMFGFMWMLPMRVQLWFALNFVLCSMESRWGLYSYKN